MAELQEVFSRIQENKHKVRDLSAQYKDALESSLEYKDVMEKLRGYKLRKKQIEDHVKAELGSAYAELESAKQDAKLDKELLVDLAINKLVSGEQVQVEDGEKNVYEPVYNVSFKKVKNGYNMESTAGDAD